MAKPRFFLNTGLQAGRLIGDFDDLDNLWGAGVRFKHVDADLGDKHYYFHALEREMKLWTEIKDSKEYKAWLKKIEAMRNAKEKTKGRANQEG